jgi:hypothetical protein
VVNSFYARPQFADGLNHIVGVYRIDTIGADPDQLLLLPGQYSSKAGLVDDRLTTGDMYAELFDRRADRTARQLVLQRAAQGAYRETLLAADRVLLRLPSGVSPDTVADYTNMLSSLCTTSTAATYTRPAALLPVLQLAQPTTDGGSTP